MDLHCIMCLSLCDIFCIHHTAQSGPALKVCSGINYLILGHLGGDETKSVLRFDAL